MEYGLLAAFWLVLSTPLYLLGWGVASVLSLPLFFAAIAGLTFAISPLVKSKPRPPVQPRPGLPVVVEHPSLGRFVLASESSAFYTNTVTWCGLQTSLSLEIEIPDDLHPAKEAATSLLRSSDTINDQIFKYLISDLLPSVNEEQKARGEPMLSPEQLRERLLLSGITINARQEYVFLYESGALLGDHWIQVAGDIPGGPSDLDFPG